MFHYREKDGLEVDAVVEAADGRWAAFEIKLGERWVDDGAKSLRRLARRLEGSDHGKSHPPSPWSFGAPDTATCCPGQVLESSRCGALLDHDPRGAHPHPSSRPWFVQI